MCECLERSHWHVLRRVDFLFRSFNLALKYEYVLEVQEKNALTGDTISCVDVLSSALPGPILTQPTPQDFSDAKSPLFRELLT